jgi:hypothetical protein
MTGVQNQEHPPLIFASCRQREGIIFRFRCVYFGRVLPTWEVVCLVIKLNDFACGRKLLNEVNKKHFGR